MSSGVQQAASDGAERTCWCFCMTLKGSRKTWVLLSEWNCLFRLCCMFRSMWIFPLGQWISLLQWWYRLCQSNPRISSTLLSRMTGAFPYNFLYKNEGVCQPRYECRTTGWASVICLSTESLQNGHKTLFTFCFLNLEKSVYFMSMKLLFLALTFDYIPQFKFVFHHIWFYSKL